MRRQLTDTGIRKLAPPPSGRLEIFDVLVPWMALRVTPNGHKSFVARGRIRGQHRPIRYTIGPASLLNVADARQRARDVLLKMQAGIDPRQEKKVQAAAVERRKNTAFNLVAAAYIKEHVAELRTATRTASDIKRYLVGAWGDSPISDISADDVSELIQRIIDAGNPAMAERVLTYSKHLFRWAASPARPRDERLTVNPAANLSSRDFAMKREPRQVALSNDHLRLIWSCSAGLDEPHTSFYRMLMLSGQRRGEVAGMRWSELDLDGERVWIIPAERMKSGRAHEVPLTAGMVELLQAMPRGNGHFVFAARDGQQPIADFHRLKARLDRLIEAEMPGLAPWVLHDIRRATRTGLGAIQSIPHDVAELMVAHVPPVLARTYNLHGYRDEKRRGFELWGERLMRIVEPPAGNVVALGRAGR